MGAEEALELMVDAFADMIGHEGACHFGARATYPEIAQHLLQVVDGNRDGCGDPHMMGHPVPDYQEDGP